MTKRTKIWLWIAALPLILIAGGIIAANLYFTGERLKALVVPELESSLHRTVSIEDISFSLLPPLVLSLDGLRIQNPQRGQFDREEFVSLDNLKIRVNLFALLSDKLEVEYIVLNRPRIYLEVTADGRKNYSSQGALKQGSEGVSPEKATAGEVLLSDVEINDGTIEFVNKKFDSRFALIGLTQKLSAQSVAGEQKIRIEGSAQIDTLGYGSVGAWYLRVHPASAALHLTYDMQGDVLLFDDVSAKLREFPLQVTGKISDLQQPANRYDLRITSPGTTMEQLLSLVPPEMLKKTEGLSSSGTVQWSCLYRGLSSETVSPGVSGTFTVAGGTVKYASLPGSISNINLSGTFDIPEAPVEKKDIGTLSVDRLSATVGSSTVGGTLGITNFDNPALTATVRGTVDLGEVKNYYPLEKGSEFAGTMKADVTLRGRAKSPETMKASGAVEFRNVTIRQADSPNPLRNLNGTITFNNEEISSKQLQMAVGNSDMNVAFTMRNYLGMVMKSAAASAGKPSAKVTLASRRLDMSDLMGEETQPASGAGSAKAPQQNGGLLPGIDLDAQVSVDTLVTKKFTFTNARGTASVSDGIVNLKNMSVNVFNGTVQSKGTLDLRNPDKSPFDLDLDIKGVQANALLSEFSSFGQYLFGKFSTTTKLKGDLNDTLGLNTQTLFGNGVVDITEGKLLGFPLTEKLAEVTSLADLREVNFRDWTNAFSIADGRLNVRDLKVNAGTTDFLVGGSQGFDGSMDYTLNVKLPSSVSDRLKLGGAAGQLLQYMKDKDGRLDITFDVGGTSMSPTLKLNAKAQEAAAKAALEQKAGDAKQKLEEELKKKAEEGLKKLFKRP